MNLLNHTIVQSIKRKQVEVNMLLSFLVEYIPQMDTRELQYIIADIERAGYSKDLPLEIMAEMYLKVSKEKKFRGDHRSYWHHIIRSVTNAKDLAEILKSAPPLVDSTFKKKLKNAITKEEKLLLVEALKIYTELNFVPGICWVTKRIRQLPEKADSVNELEKACQYSLAANEFYRAKNCAVKLVEKKYSIGEYIDAENYLNLLNQHFPSDSQTATLFHNYHKLNQLASIQKLIKERKFLEANKELINIEGKEITNETKKLRKQLNAKSIFFASDFFQKLSIQSGYTTRPKQVQMSSEIESILENNQPLIIEAEVGIGKSFAYLAPVLLWRYSSKLNKAIVVSTSSIVLQNQLLRKDIPTLNSLLTKFFNTPPIKTIIGKGKSHFGCSKRLDNLIKIQERALHQPNADKGEVGNVITLLKKFKDDSFYLDKDSFPNKLLNLWHDVSADKCNCKSGSDCRYIIYRENLARHNGIIVCNHQQLLAHLKYGSTGGEILPSLSNIGAIIVDEAHKLEEAAKTIFTQSVFFSNLEKLIEDIEDIFKNQMSEKDLNEIIDKYLPFIEESIQYIQSVHQQMDNWLIPPTFNSGENVPLDNVDEGKYHINLKMATPFLNGLKNALSNLLAGQDTIKKYKGYMKYNVYRSTENAIELLSNITKPQTHIMWVEKVDVSKEYSLHCMKKDYSDFLSFKLLRHKSPVVLVSGTLRIGESFNYMCEKFGYKNSFPKPIAYRNDFNYEENRIVYIPKHLPSPRVKESTEKRNDYYDKIAQEVIKLINLTQGKSLILFTSYECLSQIYKRVVNTRPSFKLFKQSRGVPTNDLLMQFRNDVNSCLFATGSFFEGIDIQGESLEQVILIKLPYPLLDPVLEEELNQAGNERMSKVLLPKMILQFRQAIGRLIRSESDIGIISILDSRLHNSNYPAIPLVYSDLHPSKNTDSFETLRGLWQEIKNRSLLTKA